MRRRKVNRVGLVRLRHMTREGVEALSGAKETLSFCVVVATKEPMA